jgi:3-hydroxyacyl-CoA dehydrogenase
MGRRSVGEHDKQPVRAGVVGLGLMGTNIATCLVAAGHRVVAIDKDALLNGQKLRSSRRGASLI